MKDYKIEVYLPLDALDSIICAIKNLNIGVIGEYKNCMSWYKVKSSWEASERTNPYLGNKGERYEADEYKLEFRCKENKLKEIIQCIKDIHPYEEVCINIIELINI